MHEMHREDGTVSIILRSAYVCLCVTEHWRGSLMCCVRVYICVYVLEKGREASGEEVRDEENERAA